MSTSSVAKKTTLILGRFKVGSGLFASLSRISPLNSCAGRRPTWRIAYYPKQYTQNNKSRAQALGLALVTTIAATSLAEETNQNESWGFVSFSQSSWRRRKVNCEAAATVAAAAVAAHRHSFLEEEAERHFCQEGYTTLAYPKRFSTTHAIAGNLLEPGVVERYKIYKSPIIVQNQSLGTVIEINPSDLFDKEIVLADIFFGDRINGHDGIIHGGIASLFFDDVFGFGCYEIMRTLNKGSVRRAFTANLSINFRRPLPENTRVIMRVKLTRVERRKIMMQATLENFGGSVVYSDATALYLMERKSNAGD